MIGFAPFFPSSGGSAEIPGLSQVLEISDRQMVNAGYPITDDEIVLTPDDRFRYWSLTDETLSNNIKFVIDDFTIGVGGAVESMEYIIFNGSSRIVTLEAKPGITLLADKLVIDKNTTAIIKLQQINTFPVINEKVFSVTYLTNLVTATDNRFGIAKLYRNLGAENDGPITQQVVTEEFANVYAKSFMDNVTLIDNQISYFLPSLNVATFGNTMRSAAMTLGGNTASSDRIANIIFSSTAVAGTLAFQRASPITTNLALASKMCFDFKFKFNSNIADSRFFMGLSSMYTLSAPTNVEPNTMINSIGVCKLSSSNNLHIITNDATGVASTIDLGASYPANNLLDYTYGVRILKIAASGSIVITVTRYDVSNNTISANSTIITDYTTGSIVPAAWITNNASAVVASFKHYGCILIQR